MNTSEYYEKKSPQYRINGGRMRHVMDLLPKDRASMVLDIACAGGVLARALGERGHQVWGVDISHEAIQTAEKHLKKGFALDVTSARWPEEILAKKFDVIIASEVIEHLFEPEKFLKKLLPILAPGGRVIITTPNFLFWKNRLRMLFGRFRYENEGILDFGHIRFFTVMTARGAFTQSGFRITREHHYYPNLEYRGLGWFGKYFSGFFSYQLIFQLAPKDATLDASDA